MKLAFDSLKCVKMLESLGMQRCQAEGIITSLTGIEIWNLYSNQEIDNMLSEAVREVFEREDRRLLEQKREFLEQRREFNKRIAAYERRTDAEIAEQRQQRRWTVGTIITTGLALAGYLSALIHFTH